MQKVNNMLVSNRKKKGFKVGAKRATVKMPARRPLMTTSPGIDKPAKDFLRLLADPCGAPLTGAPYGGVAGTQFYRFRTIVNPGAAAVDSTIQFCPGLVDVGPIGSNGIGAIQWTSTNVTSSNPTNLYGSQVNAALSTTIASLRCVGACIKVMYLGSEMARQGAVGLSILTAPFYPGDGTAAGLAGSFYTAENVQQEMPSVRRLGDCIHEVKWVPGFEDQQFIELSDNDTRPGYVPGAAIVASVSNAPAGSIRYEVYSCWETTPNAQYGGMVVSLKAPQSRSTLNDVLRTIDNITDFAVNAGNVIVPGIRSGLAAVAKYGPALAAAIA